ncbi:hypothetical protein CXB49_04190 [Chromobacterium sp. ATCC 53434]|uniref:hypothetical protein n=1 Tax=Chromobacterium sp. (strain ATCC 53434 / SC 14030) TaxID=2059672 RepID=UPI000C75EAE8|nr:hypothetical protein [Chromobacterium sp. ATCC 53434]AUH50074.1 hypothetical protein CXB49_04190 [Chromobacterium sp. ATCC 53434]
MSVISSQSGASAWRPSLFRPAASGEQSQAASTAADSAAAGGASSAQTAAQSSLSDPRGALQQSLNQGLQDYKQKLRVDLNRPVRQQSSEVDSMQKKALKERVEALRRMMMMTHDKSTLRALASELARLAKDLKSLVSSMTQNAADSQMTVNVDGQSVDGAAASGNGQDAAASSAGAQSDGDAGDAATADTSDAAASGGTQAQTDAAATQQAANGQSDGSQAAGQDAASNGDGKDKAVDPQAALHSMLSSGNGNPVAGDQDIQDMLRTLKMIKEFIKQQAQQLQSQARRDVQDQVKDAEKALADVDKILKGGPEAEAAMGEQMSVNVVDAAGGADSVNIGDAASGGGVNVSA